MKKLGLIAVIIIFSVFFYIWQQNFAIIMGYKVGDLNDKLGKINADNDDLMYKINSILALEKLNKIAQDKKYTRPDESSIVEID